MHIEGGVGEINISLGDINGDLKYRRWNGKCKYNYPRRFTSKNKHKLWFREAQMLVQKPQGKINIPLISAWELEN